MQDLAEDICSRRLMLMKPGTLVSGHQDVYSGGSMLWLPGDQGSRDFFPKLLGQISAYRRIAVRGLGVDMSTALGVNTQP